MSADAIDVLVILALMGIAWGLIIYFTDTR